ncbi:MAG: hypothetical protein ACOYIQ_01835 [Christensenellales bacterium]|jgi:hypothetical protein
MKNYKLISDRKILPTIVAALALLLAFICALQPVGTAYADLYEDIHVNASPGNPDELAFSINTAGYTPGTVVGEEPSITLTLTGSARRPQDTEFYFIEQEQMGAPGVNEQWILLTKDMIGDEMAVYTPTMGANSYFKKYVYFKAVIKKQDPENPQLYYEYLKEEVPVEIIVDKSTELNYAITGVEAYSKGAGGVFVPYDFSVNAPFVSTELRFVLQTASSEPTAITYQYYYEGCGVPSIDNEWVSMEGKSITFTADNAGQINGPIFFRARHRDQGIDLRYNAQPVFARLDTVSPSFTVLATKAVSGGAYSVGTWSDQDVEYTIIPASQNVSDVNYFYRLSTGDFIEIVPSTSNGNRLYKITVSQTTGTLKFEARTSAGMINNNNDTNYNTLIDKNRPQVNIIAKDKDNTDIASVGTPPGEGYRVGYASGKIEFTIRNMDEFGAPIPNTSKVTYLYSVDGGAFNPIPQSGGQYKLTIEAGSTNIYNRQIAFKLTSDAGLSDTKTFTVNILNANFTVEMAPLSYNTHNGWASENILIDFYIADGDYKFYNEISGEIAAKQELTGVTKGQIRPSDGKRHFEVVFDRPVNNAAIIFSVENMAGDVCVLPATAPINLDNVLPEATINGVVLGSQQPIRDNEWSNGKVVLTVYPHSNLSGISVQYVHTNGIPENMTANTDGNYTVTIQKTTTCVFRLISGSGLQRDLSFQVNIDLSDIDIDIQDYDLIASRVHSQDVPLTFITSHTGDFTVWYKELGVNNDFIQTQSRTFTVPVSNEIAQGTKQFVFFLEAKAIDKNGNRKRSEQLSIAIQYNRTPSVIEVTRSNDHGSVIEQDWLRGNIIFDITNLFGHTYQVSLNGGAWQDIDVVPDNDIVKFFFSGIANGVLAYDMNDGGNFNGTVSIRAINNAGYPSNAIAINNIKVDNSRPDVINAISIEKGERDAANRKIYSAADIVLRNTNGLTAFSAYAPITYYYQIKQSSDIPPQAPTEGNMGSWIKLESPVTFDQNVSLWLYARNILQADSMQINYYDFIIDNGSITFNVSFPTEAGSTKDANIFEYTWGTSAANVYFFSSSVTDVYYYYTISQAAQVPEASWMLINPGGNPAGNFTFSYTQDINATFRFRIRNRAGTEIISDNKAVIRIDNVEPTFTVEYTSGGSAYTPGTWAKEAISIKITPTAVNPGGVKYEYYFDGVWTETPSLNLTSDMIENFDPNHNGNGQGLFRISATSKVNNKMITSDQIAIKVDKESPRFDLYGVIGNNVQITSGQWSNEENVRIDIVKQNNNISDVTYYYEKNNEGRIEAPVVGGINIETSCVVTVIARSEAGLETQKDFVVNIDTIPPRIDAGKIVNPAPGAEPNQYYVDQVIYYIEENVKIAEYNGYALVNGMEISTKNVDTNLNGYVHIYIEDLAGNVAELKFYMMPFPLDINNVTLSEEDRALIDSFEEELNAAINLSQSRRAYFANQINRLRDRVIILQGQVDDFHRYLEIINNKNSFELNSDYDQMESYINRFNNYATWQRQYILSNTVKPYSTYFNKLQEQFQILDNQMNNVRAVEQQIAALPAINVVEKSDYIDIKRVHNYYESLTVAQKGKLKSTLRAKLMEVLRLCELMMLQDDATGVSIYGDNLAGGLEIEVTPYEKSTKKFIDAQQTLLDSFTGVQPRAIASIHQLSLTGSGASTITGDILITLPIPDEYSQYISFAVYKLNNNGTIVKVQGAEVAPDGRSISFGSTELATYILAVNANIERVIEDTTLYGMIGNIEIDTQMLQYIAIAVGALFALTVLILVITALKRRSFLKRFNKSYKHSLVKRGIDSIPKGNPPPRRKPSNPSERVSYRRKLL